MLKELLYGDSDVSFGNRTTEYIVNKLGFSYFDFAFSLDYRLALAFFWEGEKILD